MVNLKCFYEMISFILVKRRYNDKELNNVQLFINLVEYLIRITIIFQSLFIIEKNILKKLRVRSNKDSFNQQKSIQLNKNVLQNQQILKFELNNEANQYLEHMMLAQLNQLFFCLIYVDNRKFRQHSLNAIFLKYVHLDKQSLEEFIYEITAICIVLIEIRIEEDQVRIYFELFQKGS
ncbi:unnamed protein product [Paramecium primaurelia]|uniref:Uncharacterized protein n=1 Tax=Paramecium primaurelia TaxID=5886 RepID=A0A8S1P605_PARPR|nr:unnamed protein product [Paramecium primaurelia]